MQRRTFGLSATLAMAAGAMILMAPSALLGRAAAEDNDGAKVTDVKVCPITMHAVKGDGAGSEVVGKYKVYFCCGGCQPEFDKLSAADKEKKAEAAAKKAEGEDKD